MVWPVGEQRHRRVCGHRKGDDLCSRGSRRCACGHYLEGGHKGGFGVYQRLNHRLYSPAADATESALGWVYEKMEAKVRWPMAMW